MGKRLHCLMVSCLIAGCAVGPNYKRPPLPPAESYSPEALAPATASADTLAGAAQNFSTAREVSGEWWTVFDSPALNELVEQALKANPTITAAQAALEQAQENVYAQRGFFFPTVQASYNGQRSKLSGNTASANAPGTQGNGADIVPVGPAQPVTYNFHTAQLTVGFVPDVFGGNRRQVESLQAQADAARLQLAATYVTLATNVVAAAIQEAATRAQIDSVRSIILASTKALEILQGQLSLGYAARVDVAAQESALAQTRQLLPPLEKQLAQTRDLLRILAGNAPDHDIPSTFELWEFKLPGDLPLSLPSRLIEQRPDIRAAEEQVHAASAQIGVAVANRFPQFSINGDVGGNATQFSQMFQGAGTFWDIIGNASVTLFDGGTLKHRQHAAEKAFVQAEAQYRMTVLTALQDVADTLHAIYSDADALKAAAAAATAAETTLSLTQKQLEAGYINELAFLSAQQAYQQAQITLVQAQSTRLGDSVALFQALGGGWWNHRESTGLIRP